MQQVLAKCVEAEKEGALGDALRLSHEGSLSSDADATVSELLDKNAQRIMAKIGRIACASTEPAQALYVGERNPESYARDTAGSSELPPIVSFTTIAGRLDVVREMVDSLAAQSAQPHSINLYISTTPYLLDAGIDPYSEVLKAIAAAGVNVYTCANIGPYRKQIPCVNQLVKTGASGATPIITLDDDVHYPNNALEILLSKSEQAPTAVVAHRGRKIELNEDGDAFADYGDFTLPIEESSLANLANGRNGILYKLKFFPRAAQEYVGHIIAPTADDLWAKVVTLKKCIPTVIIESRAMVDTSLDYEELRPDRKVGLFHQYNARGSNDSALENLQCYFSRRMGVSLASILV